MPGADQEHARASHCARPIQLCVALGKQLHHVRQGDAHTIELKMQLYDCANE